MLSGCLRINEEDVGWDCIDFAMEFNFRYYFIHCVKSASGTVVRDVDERKSRFYKFVLQMLCSPCSWEF